VKKRAAKIFRIFFFVMGGLFTLIVILAFTTAPFWTWYGMGTKKAGINRPPDCIVLMGGGGMPSESGLMRTWYTAKVANWFTRARIIIALPGDTADSLSSVNQMKRELILRGVAPARIILEDSGTNTRAQALNVRKLINGLKYSHQLSLLVVTSPEHLYRAVLAFKKAGFLKVDGIPAFEQAIESNITFNARKLGGRKFIPDIGNNIALRYQFWTQVDYEFLVIREWLALGYYELMGWI
jgi:uncharacterized SAM-binding protein YcdF (DUF218 family)